MRRRRFLQTIAVAPAAPVVLAQSTSSAPSAAVKPPLASTFANVVGEPTPRFFSVPQFSALRKLAGLMMPPMNGNPGAIEAEAPEFLDFLIGVSPADRQTLYRSGLDSLNARARGKFTRPFAELNETQTDAIIRPLIALVAWSYDPPKDPVSHFLWAVQDDLRTATRNSRLWSETAADAGRRGPGAQQYLNPVDPLFR